MPSVTLNKKVVEKLIGEKLSDAELKDRISMLGTDLESISTNEIQVEIFPNRPDMLSEQGFSRALSSFIGKKTGLVKFQTKPSKKKIIIDKSVCDVRPYTACAIVKNLNFDDEKIRETIQIQEKLHVTFGRNRKKCAIGIYPMEKIHFPVTFFADSPKNIKFVPLESPGDKEMDGLKILSLHPAGREYAHLLKDLDKFPFFKDKNENILSMPPIINSNTTGRISETTKDVFIECSGFDYYVLSKCLNIIVTSLAEMGGEIESLELEYSNFYGKKSTIVSPVLEPESMKLDLNYVNSRLGLDLNEKQCINLLEKMGYGFDNKNSCVLVPCYRADVLHMIDLVEDIAIAYGYENFEEVIPKVATIGQESPLAIFERQVSDLMIGLKINEVYTYDVSNEKTMFKNLFSSNESYEEHSLGKIKKSEIKIKKPIMLANSLSEDFNCIRSSLIASLIDVLAHNKHNEYPQHVFDIGTVFTKNKTTDTGILEERFLSVAICEDKTDFTRIKQILDYLFQNIDIEYNIEESLIDTFIEGRAGKIKIKNNDVGIIGEIHPFVLENFEIDYPISCFEINLSLIFNMLKNK